MRVFFFGCWNQPGHFLFAPCRSHLHPGARRFEYYGNHVHLDGTLAPRKMREYYGGGLCWQGQGATIAARMTIGSRSEEYPQGQFLRHELDNGCTAIQWWDRAQGDTRGACNSTLLLEGDHTSIEMLEALTAHFPHVVVNLKRASIDLVEVSKPV